MGYHTPPALPLPSVGAPSASAPGGGGEHASWGCGWGGALSGDRGVGAPGAVLGKGSGYAGSCGVTPELGLGLGGECLLWGFEDLVLDGVLSSFLGQLLSLLFALSLAASQHGGFQIF